jgi:8-oxo-dGTP pyrophosphatase MutT (NUDIX family)
MSQRKNTINFSGRWQFAGGKLEIGENPVESGIREVTEETGLEIDTKRLEYVDAIFDDPTTDVCFVYLIELNETEIPLRIENEKTGDWILMTCDEALKLDLMPGLKEIIGQLKMRFDRLEKV